MPEITYGCCEHCEHIGPCDSLHVTPCDCGCNDEVGDDA